MKKASMQYLAQRVVMVTALAVPFVHGCATDAAAEEHAERVLGQSFSAPRESANGAVSIDGTMTVAINYSGEITRNLNVASEQLESALGTTATYDVRDHQTEHTLHAEINDDRNEVTFVDEGVSVHLQLINEEQAAVLHTDGRREVMSMTALGERIMRELPHARFSPHSLVAIGTMIEHDNNPNISLGFRSFFKNLYNGVKKVAKIAARIYLGGLWVMFAACEKMFHRSGENGYHGGRGRHARWRLRSHGDSQRTPWNACSK
jgi:hypothetical protein